MSIARSYLRTDRAEPESDNESISLINYFESWFVLRKLPQSRAMREKISPVIKTCRRCNAGLVKESAVHEFDATASNVQLNLDCLVSFHVLKIFEVADQKLSD